MLAMTKKPPYFPFSCMREKGLRDEGIKKEYTMKKQIVSLSIFSMMIILLLVLINCTDWDLEDDDKAPDPVTVEIVGLTDSSVSLRWTHSDDEDFKSYQVYYSTSDIVDTTDKIADTLYFSKDTVKTVTSLDANRHYYFRVIVTTYRDMISASNIVDTTTFNSMSELKLTLKPPVALSEHSVSLTWEKGWTSDYNQYWIYMDTNSTVDSTDKCVDTVNDGLTTVINGLLRSRKYWFRIYLNENGIAKHGSNIDSVTTLSGQPVACTLSVNDQSVTDTSVTLLWSKNRDIDFKRYLVYYDTIPKIDTFTVIDTADSNVKVVSLVNDTVLMLTSLKRDETYWFAVYVQDSSNYITSSNLDSATTDDGLPEPVTVQTGTVSDTSVELIWTMNNDADFYRYVVYYSDTSYGLDTISVIDTTDSSCFCSKSVQIDTTIIVVPLDRNKKYYFTVYVEDVYGLISPGTIVNATTDDGLPEPVQLSVDTNTDTTISLRWSRNIDYDFKNYEVYYDTDELVDISDSLVSSITTKNDTTLVVTGLAVNTIYWFRIYVTSNSGQKSGSNTEYNFPSILSVDTATDSIVNLYWKPSFYPDSLFKSCQLFKSTTPDVKNEGVPINNDICTDISIHSFKDVTIVDTLYYKLYHYAIGENGKLEIRGSNEVKVIH